MISCIQITSTIGPHSQVDGEGVQGISNPWHAWGADASGNRIRVVLKLAYPGLVHEKFDRLEMLIRECICSQLLSVLGIPIPTPYLATISDAVISSMRDAPAIQHELRTFPMPHFATAYMENMHDLRPLERVPAQFVKVAEDILASDTLILNADRRSAKPNLLYNARLLIAIDHGLAFELLKTNKEAIALPVPYVNNHACYQALVNYRPSFSKVFTKWVNGATIQVISEIESSIPKDWRLSTIDVDLMLNHLRAHDRRLDRIRAELLKVFPNDRLRSSNSQIPP